MMPRILNIDKKGNDEDRGVGKLWICDESQKEKGKLWQDVVCTFTVMPDTDYSKWFNFEYAAYGILSLSEKFEEWRLQMFRLQP